MKIGVIVQLKDKHAPFAIGVHYMACMCNLVVQTFFSLPWFVKIEALLQSMFVYFLTFLGGAWNMGNWQKLWRQ
jgi:hypothetical protein